MRSFGKTIKNHVPEIAAFVGGVFAGFTFNHLIVAGTLCTDGENLVVCARNWVLAFGALVALGAAWIAVRPVWRQVQHNNRTVLASRRSTLERYNDDVMQVSALLFKVDPRSRATNTSLAAMIAYSGQNTDHSPLVYLKHIAAEVVKLNQRCDPYFANVKTAIHELAVRISDDCMKWQNIYGISMHFVPGEKINLGAHELRQLNKVDRQFGKVSNEYVELFNAAVYAIGDALDSVDRELRRIDEALLES